MNTRLIQCPIPRLLPRGSKHPLTGFWVVAGIISAIGSSIAAESLAPLLHAVHGPANGSQDAVFFGTSVAISSVYSAVGEPGRTGFVKVFDPSTGNLRHLITNPSGDENQFGHSIALSGTRLAVSAWVGRAGSVAEAGQVYVYDLEGPQPGIPELILSSPAPQRGESFGYSLAFSGSRLAVGAPFASPGGKASSGRAFVFDLNNPNAQASVLVLENPTPADWDRFGNTVTTEGNRVVIGAPGDDSNGTDAGRVYVYDLSRSTPTAPALSLSAPSPQPGAAFGDFVSISGSTLAVASSNEAVNGLTGAGRVYLYNLAGTRPTSPLMTLQSSTPTAGELFGMPLVLTGSRLLVGTKAGEACLYDVSQSNQLLATLAVPNPTPDSQISLAMTGMAAMIGDPIASPGGSFTGTAFVYNLTAPTSPDPVLTLSSPTPRGDDHFASTVALSGNRLVAGAPNHRGVHPTSVDIGRAYIYDLANDSEWILENPSPANGDNFGTVTAASGDWVLISTPGDTDSPPGSATGAVYVYNFSQGTPSLPAFTITNPDANGEAGYGFGSLLAMSGQIVVAGVKSAGSAYVFDLGSTTPSLPVATLTNPNPGKGNFPWSVAIAGDVVAIGDTEFKLNADEEEPPVDGGEESPVVGGEDAPVDGDEGTPITPVETDSFLGVVHVYHLDGATGPLEARFTVSNPATAENSISYFGETLATDGNRLAVSGHTFASGDTEELVYLYNLSPTSASAFTTFVNPAPQIGDEFGASLAFMGEQLAVGVPSSGSRLPMDPPFENTFLPGAGEVYIYDLDLETLGVMGALTVPQAPVDPRLASGYRFGAAVVADADRFAVGTPAGGFDFRKRSAFVFGKASKRPAIFTPIEGSIPQRPISVSIAIRELIEPGTLTLSFNNLVLSLAASQERPGSHTFTFDPANPPASLAIASGTPIPDGVYQLTLTYQNRKGDQVTSSPVDNVTVDTTPPLIGALPDIGVASQNRTGAVVTFPAATVTDAVGLTSVSYSRPSGSHFPPGATDVIVTAEDKAGNTSSAVFSVSVLNVAITKPAENAVLPFSTKGVQIEGAAESSITAVTVSLNGAAPVPAALTAVKGGKRWSLTVTNLNNWRNTAVVTAVSGRASVSSPPRTFYHQVTGPLPVTITPAGTGSVTFSPPLIRGRMAAFGRAYTVTAVAKPTSTFDKWTGILSGGSATASFVFQEGATIGVEFIPTSFTSSQGGNYAATLLGNSTESDVQDNAGFFSATVLNTSGSFSARVILDGLSTSFTGSFYHASGNYQSPLLATGLSCDLTLDSTGPVNRITGTVTRWSEGAIAATLVVNAPQVFDSRVKPPADFASTFNIALQSAPNAQSSENNLPNGDGVATLTINGRNGTFTIKGFLADGFPFTSSASVTRDGTVPIYVSFAKRSGSLSGTATIDPLQLETDVSGEGLRWFRREHTGHYYPAGFGKGRTLRLIGAKQQTSSPVGLGLSTSPRVDFSGGPFGSAVNEELRKISPTRYTSADQTIRLEIGSTGQISGYYKSPVLVGNFPIRGVVIGKGGSADAFGYILSPLPAKPDGNGKGGLIQLLP